MIKQKTVIANYGASGQGKSASIITTYEEIKRRYPQFNRLRDTKGGGDISVLFEINNIKFGIESQGDPNSRIFESLDEFLNENCDIIICACRTSGATIEKVRELRRYGYRIIWAQNLINDSIHTQLNEIYANLIISLIDGIMNNEI